MSAFRKTSIIFGIVFTASAIAAACGYFSWFWLFIPAAIYSLFLFFGSKNICSQFYMQVKCFSENKARIQLSFDDGPHPTITPQILRILKKYNQKALFFCIGKNIEKYPEMAKQIVQEGHKIGNHSYSHAYTFDFFSVKKVQKELQKTNEIIERITGTECTVFRPPYGVTNPNIAKAVKNLNMQAVGWSIRSLDTLGDKESIKNRIKKAKPGDIILFHDTKENTPEILEDFLRLKND